MRTCQGCGAKFKEGDGYDPSNFRNQRWCSQGCYNRNASSSEKASAEWGSRVFSTILLSPITLSIKLIKLILKPLLRICWICLTNKWVWTICSAGILLVVYKMLKYIYEKK